MISKDTSNASASDAPGKSKFQDFQPLYPVTIPYRVKPKFAKGMLPGLDINLNIPKLIKNPKLTVPHNMRRLRSSDLLLPCQVAPHIANRGRANMAPARALSAIVKMNSPPTK